MQKIVCLYQLWFSQEIEILIQGMYLQWPTFFPQNVGHLPKVANFWPLLVHGVFRRKEIQMRQNMVIQPSQPFLTTRQKTFFFEEKLAKYLKWPLQVQPLQAPCIRLCFDVLNTAQLILNTVHDLSQNSSILKVLSKFQSKNLKIMEFRKWYSRVSKYRFLQKIG